MQANLFITGAACVLFCSGGAALAQSAADPAANFPAHPVTMVTPFSPGGGAEIEGRLFATALGEHLGQQFVMDFKPGGTMAVGLGYAARQKPDGYTYIWAAPVYALTPLILTDVPFDPVKDFDPVSLLNQRASVLTITPSLPAKNLKEFVAYAKAHPGELNYGDGGPGGSQHLLGLLLEAQTGIKMAYVHYKSIGGTYPDLMAGRIQVAPIIVGTALPMLKGGKLRGIAVSSRERNPAMPELPTAIEQGVNWEYTSWLGLLTVAGTPAPIVNKVQRELARIVKEPDFRKKFAADTTLVGGTPAEFKRFYTGETARWKKLAADNNITISGN